MQSRKDFPNGKSFFMAKLLVDLKLKGVSDYEREFGSC